MVKSKEDILAAIKEKFSDDTSDSTLSLIEDVSDTINDLQTKASNEGAWQKKYEENDKQWREKYKERFFSGSPSVPEDPDPEPEPAKKKPLRYEDLFTTGKE